jgi:hypothetical protein
MRKRPKTVRIETAKDRNHAFNLAKSIARLEKPDFIFTQWENGARCYKRIQEKYKSYYIEVLNG